MGFVILRAKATTIIKLIVYVLGVISLNFHLNFTPALCL